MVKKVSRIIISMALLPLPAMAKMHSLPTPSITLAPPTNKYQHIALPKPILSLAAPSATEKQPASNNTQKQEPYSELIPQPKSKQTIKEQLDSIKQKLKKDQKNKELLYQKSLLLISIDRYQSAVNILKKINKPKNKEYTKIIIKLENVIKKQKKKIEKAQSALKKDPENIGKRLELIHMQTTINKFHDALIVIKQGLILSPNNELLMIEKLLIEIDIGEYIYAKRTLDKVLKKYPNNSIANNLKVLIYAGAKEMKKEKVRKKEKNLVEDFDLMLNQKLSGESKKRKNFIGYESYPTDVTDSGTWLYDSLYYGRITDNNTYILRLNHATRVGKTGFQYNVQMYPKFGKHLYLHASYSYSDSTLFPRHQVFLRAHLLLPKNIDVIVGGQYYKIVDLNLYAYYLWVSKYFGEREWFGVKPIIFQAQNGDTVVYTIAAFRYYFAFPNTYLSVSAGAGEAPDLLDLSAAGFVFIKMWHIFADYQWPIYKKDLYLHLGLGYMDETFPNNKKRKKIIFFVALKGLF